MLVASYSSCHPFTQTELAALDIPLISVHAGTVDRMKHGEYWLQLQLQLELYALASSAYQLQQKCR
jgi:hypothetical protein